LLAVSLSLAILGEVFFPKSSPVLVGWPKNAEGGVLAIVFWAVVSAAAILAMDVAWPSKPEGPSRGDTISATPAGAGPPMHTVGTAKQLR
jgi:hypothetical protein